jgi:hypothetical protein
MKLEQFIDEHPDIPEYDLLNDDEEITLYTLGVTYRSDGVFRLWIAAAVNLYVLCALARDSQTLKRMYKNLATACEALENVINTNKSMSTADPD